MTINKFRYLALAVAVLLGGLALTGCDPDENVAGRSEEASRTYTSRPVDVTIGGTTGGETLGGTRSQVEIDDAAVSKVTIFLFDHSTGRILLRDGGQPWVTEAFSNTFSFDLPVGTVAVDIYTICNYGNTSLPTGNTNLSSSDLDGLMYTISSISQLTAMPMAGVDSRTITPETTSLNLTVDRLFAIYYVNFDLSEVQAAGYTIDALYLTTHSVNKSVHWFRPSGGDAATQVNDMLDYASSQELLLMAGGASCYVYVTENMQGTIPGASSWRTVQSDLGAAVAKCTYIDLGVKVHRSDWSWQNAYFQVYLGNGDMTSQFDIPRNYKKNITIKIPASGIVPSPDYPAFSWSQRELGLEPGGSATATFTCSNISASELTITSSDDNVTVSGVTVSGGSGSCVITASGSVSSSLTAHVTGGDTAGKCQDDLAVSVTVAPQTEERRVVLLSPSSSTISAGGTQTYTTYLRYDIYDLDGNLIQTGEPTEVYPSYFTWSSSNTGVATVSDGVATGVGAGATTITAAYRYGQNESATATLNVEGGSVTTYRYEYVLSPESSSILVNETQGYTVTKRTYTIIDGVEQPGYTSETVSNSLFDWSSSSTGVATVSGGNATGVDNGTATVTATLRSDSSVTATATLTVSHLFQFTGGDTTIEPGGTATLYFNTTLALGDINFDYPSGYSRSGVTTTSVIIHAPSNASGSANIHGGNDNKGSGASDDRLLSVTAPVVTPTVASMVITEVTNHGLTVYGQTQYQFKCVVTMSNGDTYDSSVSSLAGRFHWDSQDDGQGLSLGSNGEAQVDGTPGSYTLDCFFKLDGSPTPSSYDASASVTITVGSPTYQYVSSQLTDVSTPQDIQNGLCRYAFEITVDKYHGSVFVQRTVHTVSPNNGPDLVWSIGNLGVNISVYDSVVNGPPEQFPIPASHWNYVSINSVYTYQVN